MYKDEDDVQRVVNGIETWLPDLWEEKPLVHISDGTLASDEMVSNVLAAKENGKKAMTEFIARFCTTGGDLKFYDPIKKQVVKTFETMNKPKAKDNTIPEDECESFATALAKFDNVKLNLKYLTNWCLTS